MRWYLVILATAALAACSGGKDEDTGTGTDTDGGGPDCTNAVVETFPEADDLDVYYRTDVRVTLSEADPDATIKVTDASGAEVPGTSTTADGLMLTWSGTDPLAPTTAYTATVDFDCGPATFGFTTSNTGNPVEVPVTDLVYELDLASGEWVEPPGVGALISANLGGVEVLVSPKEVTATEITMIGALGDGTGAQDVCTPSLDFGQAAAWSDPFFELSSPLLTLEVLGTSVDIENLVLSGAFAPDGTRIQGAALQGSIDTRQLADILQGEDACELVAVFGIACEECSDGSGPYCLSVNVDNISAMQVTGATPLQVVVQADIDANPNCTTP